MHFFYQRNAQSKYLFTLYKSKVICGFIIKTITFMLSNNTKIYMEITKLFHYLLILLEYYTYVPVISGIYNSFQGFLKNNFHFYILQIKIEIK